MFYWDYHTFDEKRGSFEHLIKVSSPVWTGKQREKDKILSHDWAFFSFIKIKSY